jgi:hypothetical protein
MSNFFHSTSSRFLSVAVGAAALGGGAAVLAGGTLAIPFLCAGILLGIVLSLFALALGIEEGFLFETALAVVLLPFVLFLYIQAQGLMMEGHHAAGGFGLIVFGLGFLARAVFASPRSLAQGADQATAH